MTEQVTITLKLTAAEYAKLQRLAEASQRTVEQCLRSFVQTCQPGGSGWRPPHEAAKEKTT